MKACTPDAVSGSTGYTAYIKIEGARSNGYAVVPCAYASIYYLRVPTALDVHPIGVGTVFRCFHGYAKHANPSAVVHGDMLLGAVLKPQPAHLNILTSYYGKRLQCSCTKVYIYYKLAS